MRLVRIMTTLAAVIGIPTIALGATTWGDRQAIDIRTLKVCVELWYLEHGEYPATDSNATWFQKLVEANYLSPDHLRCGTTVDAKLPLDLYGRLMVYEVMDPNSPDSAVIRSVGADGVDNQGAGDDFDSRYGANLGYWYKSNWPQFFAFIGGGWLFAVIAAVIVWLKTRRIGLTIFMLLLIGGMIVGVMSHFFFDGGVARSTASRIPECGHSVIFYSLLGLLIALGMAVPGCVRSVRRSRASQRGLCRECGYDLRGKVGGRERCPECGAATVH